MKTRLVSIFFTVAFFCSTVSFTHATTWIVDAGGGGDFVKIQEGIDAAINGDTVLVKDGTYTGTGNKNLDYGGKAITVESENGADFTIIDCENDGSGFYFHSGETNSSVVRGFTIRNGYAPDTGWGGGGIRIINGSSPTITNCTITDNYASNDGGGIYCNGGSPSITNCTITGNTGPNTAGGGIYSESSSPSITNCTIAGNDNWNGGGIYCAGGSPSITNCTITDNNGWGRGGGIYCGGGSPSITNCTITDNYSDDDGAGILCNGGSLSITNCTITGNGWVENGGGIFCFNGASVEIINSILWGSSAGDGSQIYIGTFTYPSTLSISYSDVQGGQSGVSVAVGCTLNWLSGNIDADPLFVTGPQGDYYLSQIASGQGSNSPCLDTGDPAIDPWPWVWTSLTTRTDQVLDTGIVDMGYHYLEVCIDEDADGDGYIAVVCGGDDCDDNNSDDPGGCASCTCGQTYCADCAKCIHPGAVEFYDDGIDSNCNGLNDVTRCSGHCRFHPDTVCYNYLDCPVGDYCEQELGYCSDTMDPCNDDSDCEGLAFCVMKGYCASGIYQGFECLVDVGFCSGGDDLCRTESDCPTGESCDPVENCPGTQVECIQCCLDNDYDGYGIGEDNSLCVHPEIDCDDSTYYVNPGRAEVPGNGYDDDCNPFTPPYGTPASVACTKYEQSSGIVNTLLVFLPIGAVIFLRILRRKK